MMKVGLASVIAITLVGCGETKPPPPAPAKPEITGWERYKFGMSFDDALAVSPNTKWNGWGLQQCIKNLALEGCLLNPDRETNYFPPIEGISFAPSLSFNKFGQLTDITLIHERHGNVTAGQCEELFVRTLDRLAREDGPFAFSDPVVNGVKEKHLHKRSPGGTIYSIGTGEDSFFITSFHRNRFDGDKAPTSLPINKWNDRAHISIFGVKVDPGKSPMCNIRVRYAAKPSMAR